MKMTSTLDALKAHWKEAWTPPPRLNAWKWCEENVFMPAQATPRPGRYSTDMVPYVRTPMECWTDKSTKYIVLMWSAQSTKTTCEFMCMAYTSANYLGNVIFNMPSEDMARSKAETTWFPIIDSSPALKCLKPSNRNKFKITEQHMRNGVINFIGGNSATNLASRSAGRIFTDEIDKLKQNLVNEADPLSLLFERAAWFPSPKIFLTSTPTIPEAHINQWFLKGTQEHFYYPCPHCDEYFTAKWREHVRWNKSDDLTIEQKAATVYIECPSCKGHIFQKDKRKMLSKGEWRAHNHEVSKTIRSFHFNRIMSPVSKLSDMVVQYLQAVERARVGDIGELKNFVNSALAEVWHEERGKVKTNEEIEELVDLRKRGEVPKEALGLVAGIDTQDDGFYFTIHAFGESNTSWLIDEGFLTEFEDIEKVVLESEYDNKIVEAVFMDAAGHRTDEVYKFCRKHINRVIPCFGRSGNMQNEYMWSEVDKAPGVKTIGGLRRLSWKTVWIKDIMFAKMKVNPGAPGSFNIHSEALTEYKKALTSEYKDDKGIYTHRKHIPNHFLDCTALAFLGAQIMHIEYRVPQKPEPVHAEEGLLNNEQQQRSTGLW